MIKTRITFHDNKSKAMFIAENGIGKSEIIEEGSAFLTIKEVDNGNQINWNNNGWVYAATRLNNG